MLLKIWLFVIVREEFVKFYLVDIKHLFFVWKIQTQCDIIKTNVSRS